MTSRVLRRPLCRVLAACFLALSLGCGSQQAKVTGRVTLDGKELKDGDLILVPEDPKEGPDAAKIVAGRFEVKTKPGKKKVEVRAARELPAKKDAVMGGSGVPQFESIIPEKYNDRTELTLDVPASGVSDKVFELKTR